MRASETIRDTFHLTRTFAPRRPLGRPAPDSPGASGLATAAPVVDTFSPAGGPFRTLRSARLPSTRPVANGSHASLSLGVARRLLQPVLRRAGTPYEPSILAREWSFRPAARRHQPMPVASASTMRCRTGGLRATIRTRRLAPPCSTCVDEAERGPKRSSEGEPRALGRCRACPPRDAPGTRVTGAICSEVWRTSRLVAPAETPLGCRPAKGDTVEWDQGAFCRTGTLTRAEDGSSVRAWTAAPSRRLRGGIARELARLFDRFSGAFF